VTRVNRQWRLARRPEGAMREGDLELHDAVAPEAADGQALVRNLYLSLDPTNRLWTSDIDQYMPPVEINSVMRGGTIGVVEESKSDYLRVGNVVVGMGGWQDYVLGDEKSFVRLPKDGLPLTAHLSVLGVTGLTAYFGLLDVGKPQQGQTVVVSAAAGAVGSIVGQIAKLHGCRVVGIAGGPDKCRWLTDELGFDAAVDYKRGTILEDLRTACPDGIDVHFENVGGEILDAALTLINLRARIVICGLIASYNAVGPVPGPYMFRNILMKRARCEGFIIFDYARRYGEATAALREWIGGGRLKYSVEEVAGLEHAPAALNKLFEGSNAGKLIVKIGEIS
jgi:NADPH-dependent curcumin reductase